MTKYAQQILDIINASSEHLTAEQIYLRLKGSNSKVVLATVYNNLSILYQQDQIRKVSVEGYPDRYDKIIKHDHLVCKMCGALSDICLSDLTAQLQAQIPEEILSYDLKINYICPSCRTKIKNEEQDRSNDRSPDKGNDRSPDRSNDRSPDRSNDRSPDKS